MKKNLKIVFIVCLVLGIALGALNLYAASQRGHLAELEEQPGLLVTDIDLERAEAIRGQIPILKGRRTDLYQLRYEK